MKPHRCLLTRLWVLLPVKLGRCPYCMRAAARGTAAAWTAAAVLYLLWPGSFPPGVAVVVALGFTTLLFAHMIAYTRRVVPLVFQEMGRRPGHETDQERRQFLKTAVRLGIGAVALSLWGFGRTVLAVDTGDNCTGAHNPDEEITAVDLNEARCKQKLVSIAREDVCPSFCLVRSCFGTCEYQGRRPGVEIIQVTDLFPFVECTGKVTACHCRCKKK